MRDCFSSLTFFFFDEWMDASKHNIIENICKITISDTGLSKLAFMPMRVVNSANINPVLHCKALSKKFIFHRLTSIGRPNNVCVCVCEFGFNVAFNNFSVIQCITTVSGCDRELNATFIVLPY